MTTTREEIFTRVRTIVIDQLAADASAVTPYADLADDLGVDSLDMVELVMALEEEFDICIPDDDADTITTVQSIVDYVVVKTT